MSIIVDPDLLDGYAGQLERNAGYFNAPLAEHCDAHCGRTDGMTGLLAAARPAVEQARETTLGLFVAGERNLFQLATNIRAAAARYRAGDIAAAERIGLVLPRHPAPQGYRDRDDDRHPGDLRDPFVPRPEAPPERHEADEAVEELRHHLGVVDEWLERYAHFSLGEQVRPWLIGDWDALRRDADAYAALAGPDGVTLLGTNLAYGLDSVSASWDSAAATQFAFTVRDRWVPAITALQHVLELHKEAFECLAQQSANALQVLTILVEVLKFVVIDKVLRIIKLAAAVARISSVWQEIIELIREVLHTWHLITLVLDSLRAAFEGVREALQLLAAEARMIDELWLARGESRLDPIIAG
jgi:hypothetical protein